MKVAWKEVSDEKYLVSSANIFTHTKKKKYMCKAYINMIIPLVTARPWLSQFT